MQGTKAELLENFSVRLKGLMEQANLSLQDVADALGRYRLKVSVSTVGAWRRAQNFPSIEITPPLAELLGTTPEFLIYGISRTTRRSTNPASDIMEEESQVNYGQHRKNNGESTDAKTPPAELFPVSSNWDADEMWLKTAFPDNEGGVAESDYPLLSRQWLVAWASQARSQGASDSMIYSELRRKLRLDDFAHLEGFTHRSPENRSGMPVRKPAKHEGRNPK